LRVTARNPATVDISDCARPVAAIARFDRRQIASVIALSAGISACGGSDRAAVCDRGLENRIQFAGYSLQYFWNRSSMQQSKIILSKLLLLVSLPLVIMLAILSDVVGITVYPD
jgi:hypothetical protein